MRSGSMSTMNFSYQETSPFSSQPVLHGADLPAPVDEGVGAPALELVDQARGLTSAAVN
jgi:hypothetical protein